MGRQGGPGGRYVEEEKKAELGHEETDSEEAERLGPYVLHEHVPQEGYRQGELYLASHEASGVRTLVLKPGPSGPEAPQPQSEWEARCVASAEPPYLAIEVESTRCARNPERPGVEEMMSTFEQMRNGLERMARLYLDFEPKPRPAWQRLAQVLAACAVACALVFAAGHLASPSPSGADAGTQVPPEVLGAQEMELDEVPESFTHERPEHPPVEDSVLARPMPSVPFKGQKRPPCTPRSQEEVVGACWAVLEAKAPCPKDVYESKGKCYLPILIPEAPPYAGDN